MDFRCKVGLNENFVGIANLIFVIYSYVLHFFYRIIKAKRIINCIHVRYNRLDNTRAIFSLLMSESMMA